MCKCKKYCNAYVVMLYVVLGMTHGEICEETGWSSSAIGNVISRRCLTVAGVHIKPRTHRKHFAKGFDIDQIKREYLDGATTYELGEKYGVAHQTISKWMRRYGVHVGRGFSRPTMKTCARCSRAFTATRPNQSYCSSTCKNMANWTRRHDRFRIADKGEDIPLGKVYERDKGRCYICGQMTDWNDYHIVNGYKAIGSRYPTRDHVIAINSGGTHTWDNVRLACHGCNSRKSDSGQMRLSI